MMNIPKFMYQLNKLEFSIWVENEKLKYRLYKDCANKNDIIANIKDNKNIIIEFLKINNIYTSNLVNQQHIYTGYHSKEVLSYAQERLWFIEKYEGGTNAYNVPMVFKLANNVKLDILERSIKSLVSRHEVLRTLIKEDEEGHGYQLVLDDKENPLEITKIKVTNREQLESELSKKVNHIYDLGNEYPIRVDFYELINNDLQGSTEYYLSIVIHHIAFDGWSSEIFLRELQEFYRHYLDQSQSLESHLNLPDLSIQYKDFALWQRSYLSGERLDKQLTYWKGKLSGYETLNLVTDKPRPSQIDYTGADIYFELDEETSRALRELAKELKVSLYSLLLSGYYLMLRSYSNQNDIVIGTPVANRHYSQIENLIGFFINSLALRIEISSKATVKEFIKQVGNEVVEAQLHQDLPFEKLVEELKVAKDNSRHPIFQVLFELHDFGSELQIQTREKPGINSTNLFQAYDTKTGLYNIAKFDLSTYMDNSQAKLRGCFNYAVNLYTETTITGFIETYSEILRQLARLVNDSQGQQTKIADVNYLTEERYNQVIYTWNQTDKEYPSDKTIHALFEEQVERAPDNIAVVYEDQSLTYKELNEHANQLANYLRQAHDIEPDTLIALCLDRSEHMLISLLAVLKAGAAYVPIDPSYPDERIQYVLKDTKTKIVLTNEIHKQKLNELSQTCGLKHKKSHHQIDILGIDSEVVQKQLSLQLASNPLTEVTSTNLAYVIYTSGSTGNPKGVMIEHRAYVETINCVNDLYFSEKNNSNTYSLTNYVFDIFGLEYGLPLLGGGTIFLLATHDFESLDCSNCDFIQMTPSLCSLKLNCLVNAFHIKLLIGGEILNQELLNNILKNSIDVINVYGPTETTIWSTSEIYHSLDTAIALQKVKLGKPFSNEKAYVLGTDLELLPIGGIGELHIGGVGLARGYLNRPDLTAERFITNPFQSEEEKKLGKNARLYKTGDLVRWLADGNLEYIGRNDFQVKIRGYRIELGEIEAVLSNYAGIRQSVVIAKEQVGVDEVTTGNKYLVGYYVSEDKLAEEDILNYLKSKLPEYMVPTVLVHLEELPLTINGKLDRKALPEAELTNSESYVAPRNELESRVCQIWAEVLSLAEDKVGICDDYFGLGGNSILAIRLVSKLNKELNSSISVSAIFKNNTVDKLVRYLKHSNEDKVTIDEVSIDKVEEQSLSYAQERLWFIEKYEGGTNAYNVPMVFKLANNVKLDILERSIKSLVSRHEVLRTLIKEDEEGHGYQLVLDDKENPLEITKIKVTNREQLESELSKKVNHIYDLGNEYPIRVDFYELINNDLQGSTEYYLSIVIHHIAFDGWSSEIFLRELQEFYRHYLDQSQSLESHLNLPDLSIQYKDFALWQRSYLSGERLDKQLTYWKGKLSGYETLNLVTDKPRPSQIDYTGADIYFELDEETSRALRELAKELKVSLYSLLLSGYYLMLRSYSNQNDIVIGTPVANRHYSQIENLIGFFINSLALRIEISSKATVKEFIKQVGNEVVEAQLHQDLPFEKLVEELKVAKDNSRHPIFQVLFELHDFGSELQIQTREKPGINSTNLFQAYDTKTGLYNIAKFDLRTYMDNSQARLRGYFNYTVNLYTESTITGFIETYQEILKQLAHFNTDTKKLEETKISDVSYLTEERYKQVVFGWNETEKIYPSDKTIHELFEEQVEKTPNNIAVVYGDQSLTYKELNERANQLGHYLRKLGVEPDTLVAIVVERSLEMMIGLLGILKAGGAYVPLDPNYPAERLQFILEDTQAPIILTDEHTLDKVPSTFAQVIALDEEWDAIDKCSSANLVSNVSSYHLAYVIYTSGSTGKPKGVMIEHNGVVNYIFNINYHIPLLHKYKIDFSTNIGFDLTVTNTVCSLCLGSQIIIFADQLQDLESYKHHLIDNNINVVKLLPSYFELLLDIIPYTNIKIVILGGEKLTPTIIDKLFNLETKNKDEFNLIMYDEYGPTEATVGTCNSQVYPGNNLTIGRPYYNTKAYVLGTDLELLPIGGIGELHIGGVGLARGYLNRPDLTAERFITNPFQSEEEKKLGKNARLYKTGDLVRWLADGNLEYIGRNDFQVKIRGYRIELGEIEAVLSNYAGIRQSVVIAKEQVGVDEVTTGNKYLVGYYVSEDKLAEEDILNYLKSKLPEYMVPTVLVHLEELPLTINGKLDRKALPEAELTNSESYVAPRNELESRVCQIWAEVLSLAEDKVGICDDYFGLGGNSILAIRLVSKLNKELNSSISVSAIFKNNTVDKLVRYLKHSNEDKVTIDEVSIDKVEEQSLSYAQERLWFIEKYEGGTNAYNVPMVFKLANNVKLDILERSIKSLVSRHEVLRTLIKEDEEGHGYQLVLDDKENPLEITKIKVTNREQLESELSKKVNHIYDLGNEYPIRVDFYELINNDLQGSTEYYLSIVIHHIAFDGWSSEIFLRELQEFYRHYLDQSQSLESHLNLPDLSIQYKDFALWQRSYLSGERLDKQLTYWKGKLSGYETLNLVTDKPRPSQIDYTGADIYFELDEETSRALRELAKELKVSLYSLLLSGYYLMLRSYSNQNDIVIGTPVANRHYSQIENLIGFFINSLALRIEISSKATVKEFIKQVGNEVVEAQLHQDLPFEKLVEELKVAKDNSRHPIFQVLFELHDFGSELQIQTREKPGINSTNLFQAYDTKTGLYNIAKFDLSTYMDNSQAKLRGCFNYAVNLYTETTITGFIETYSEILRQLARLVNDSQGQQTKIADVNYLTEERYNQVIYTWNQTDKEYPSDKTIHALFEEQVERAPDNIAVVYEDQSLTYKELNEHANQLANYLRQAHDIEPDTLIALCLDRSEHMLISLLAVLKAGAAYVPIDPSYPDERIQYVLKDTKTKIVLTNEIHKQKLNELSQTCGLKHKKSHHQIDILGIDSEVVQKQLSLQLASNPLTEVTSTNLAYVIYTSGSTGNPKGVMIEHRGVVNRIKWMNDTYPINETDKILQKTPYIFDVSVWELLWANWCGASIVFAKPEGHKDPGYIIDLMNKESITIVHFVPSILGVFQDTLKVDMGQLNKASPIPTLRYVFCSGEELKLTHVQECHNLLPSTEVHNLYGPTEASIDVLFYNCNDKNIEEVYIGNPISNTKAYVLGTDLELLPIGGIGELHIGGVGLARGYLNRPDLTAERFITNPFQSEEEKKLGKNARLYKTGDLVRWLADGNLEYIGRNDFQVKIRGYRIELGEIEAVLSNYAGIRQSVVIAKEQVGVDEVTTGNKYLVGYYVSEDKLAEEDILNYLKSKLPEYMVPTVLVHLEELPLTINGKLDRKALPEAELTNSESYVAPRNELESRVCQIWAEVLSLAEDKVGICDDYFGLGGNSILAIRLVSKLNKELNSSISVSAIFKNNTVDKLVRYLKHSNEDKVTIDEVSIDKVEEQSLSYAQERLWFIEKYEGGTNAYNVPMVFKLANNVKLDILERSIKSLVSRHEVLRTLIKEDEEGHGYQLVLDDKENPLEITKIKVTNREQLESELSKKVNHIYDLGNEYPIRVDFYELINNDLQGSTEYYLSIVIHHIAFDGWSSEIFLRELQEFYRHYLDQSQSLESHLNLPDLSIQYKDFALWQRSYLSGERLDKQLTYWKGKLSGYETLNLVTDKPRPSQIDYTGADIYFELDEETSRALRELAKELKVSLYSLLLSGYYLMLRSYSNQNDIVIGTPVANRHYSQIENLIGFFINSLALRIEISSKATVKEFIKQVGNEVVEAQLHQDLPFEKLVEELKVAKDNSRHPIFQVLFELHDFGSELQIQTREKPGINSTNLFQAYDTKTGLYNIAKLDLSTYMNNSQIKLRGCFNYTVNLYTESTITGFIETYQEILKQLAHFNTDTKKLEETKISDVSYLTEERYKQVVFGWNETEKIYPSDKTIHELFEEQVEKTPNNIAVVYGDQSLTYKELNERANQLGHYLRKLGVEPDTLVAIVVERSLEMMIGLLGILKAGGAYVPLDPNYPAERLQFILEDTQAPIILTDEHTLDKVPSTFAQVIALDEEWDAIDKCSSANLVSNVSSYHLAYVIYTSGSTGKPKGVMIAHNGVVNLAVMQGKEFGLTNTNYVKNCLWYANYVFDAHVSEVYLSILNGHILYIIDNFTRQDINLIDSYIKSKSIDIATIPPALLNTKTVLELDILVVAGDKINKKIFDIYKKNNKKMINAYGPSEATVCTSLNHYNNNGSSNIGSLIFNTKAYVLGTDLELLPIGGIGELHIGGVGLARGYLNRPDLTAERFITNPFQSEEEKKLGKNTRLYKTGDLVRWLADGNLEYIGRNDFQVKIRGYRIELGEIEAVLSNYAGIRQSVVIAKEQVGVDEVTTGNKYLVGYYVSEDKLAEEDILNYLKSKLPEYMVPTVLVHLEELPLTINGKLDRKALPEAELTNSESYVAPRNELESRVCQIWAEVLSLAEDKVGICDDYFGLGGDSIISIQLISKIKQTIGINVSIKDIFSYKTIEKLYDNVLDKEQNNTYKQFLKTEQGSLSGIVELLPIQKWFFKNSFLALNHWNQAFIIKTQSLNLDRLQLSISKLVEHHDNFKLRYREVKEPISIQNTKAKVENTNYIQYYDPTAKEEKLRILNIRLLEAKEGSKEFEFKLEQILTDWQSGFDIKSGPVYSIGYIHGYADGSARVYFALHHLVVDSVSCRILADDLRDLYSLRNLGSKGSSFRQWVNVVKEYPKTHESELDYWKSVLSGYDSNDKPLTSLVVSEDTCNYADLSLNKEETKKILKESNKVYCTQINDLLLTALGLTLSELTGRKINHIVLEGHGREEIDSSIDITRTLGWFTTMYPVRLEVSEELGSSIKNIKENLRQIPNKGIGYGALIGYQVNTLPRISFNYLGQFGKENEPKDLQEQLSYVNQTEKTQLQSSWKITGENNGIPIHPDNQDYNIISINGIVIDGSLKFNIKTKLDELTTKKIATLYKQKLQQIISHCIDKENVEYTMSDFSDFEPYVMFNESVKHSNNSLFIFPPGDGGAESYFNNIVAKLNNTKLALFNNYYNFLENKLGMAYASSITYEKLARDYIFYIKLIQPEGPYNLFGWSFGGVLAFEVARQLINIGDIVASLVLVDSFFNYKKVALKTNSQLIGDNYINFKYSPPLSSIMLNTNIILFKALRSDNDLESKDLYNIFKYYAEDTKNNNLDELLKDKNFKVITMDHNHNSWINNDSQIIQICNELLKTL